MVKVLYGLAALSIIVGIISGFVLGNGVFDGFGWGLAITRWISGAIAGIVLFAIGMILENVEDTNERVRNLEYELLQKNVSPPLPTKLGNSKANLSKLSGFQIGKSED
ncbi:hypothetical protein [Cohnella sp. JJ-181]|uniref:hypothetical protein n=1 Tax=Cohnella rhizoplanae TaxID=2974897 RepID=UPI0022FFA7C4|nr:hypothetical protein [Cohnella sp. JJ-181]CAI6086240.1 hypothetical protein COHCIP112018_04965 [Cohnella sp. JJ-181]